MEQTREAYLDIETTGLAAYSQITVIGVYLTDGIDDRLVQLVGENITAGNLLELLEDVSIVYTYNGSRFDLPVIDYHLGLNLASLFTHCDLMYDCWRNNLYGGLKSVERQLGVERRLKGVDGYEAVKLWWRYQNQCDEDALETLLQYNREDAVNLKTLKVKLQRLPIASDELDL